MMDGNHVLRAVVVDDEQLAREEVCYLLGEMGGVHVVGQAGDGVEALQVIEAENPDLVMLDVQMPGLTGFEVARKLLAAGIHSQLVFVTAYDQHAIQAFDVNAVDYLLKPVEAGRLEQALQRARRRLASERANPNAASHDPSAPSWTDCCSCSRSGRSTGTSWR
jgi:DNA-binding LytR/AlgR family response regulator